MKIKRFTLLISLFALSITLGLFGVIKSTTYASEQNSTSTNIFVPSSPIEFLDLNSPIAVSYSNDGYYIISEYSQNEETLETYNKISIYNPTYKSYKVLPEHDSLNSISQIEKHGDFIYYVSQSKIYYIPVSDLTKTPTSIKDENGETVICANYFSFNNNNVLSNTNNTANIYQIQVENSVPTFKNLYSIKSFAKQGYLGADGNVYLLENGTLKYFRASDKTIISLTTINTDVISLQEVGDYIYFTTIDGLYKVKKQQNEVPSLVMTADKNATELGSLSSPKGICAKGNNLLIADNQLNSIQELDTLTDKFTTFAITTESSVDYRLTKYASNIVLSENYLYALDNSSLNLSDENPRKRIVKISLGAENKTYSKIDLSSLYEENLDLNIKFFVASDTHVLIYDGEFVSLYKQEDSSPITLTKIYSCQTSSVTALNYLDGAFYYSDTSRTDYTYDTVNLHKLTLPSLDNELSEVTNTLITKNTPEIVGVCSNFTIDIFGNFLILYKEGETSTENKLVRLYNSYLSTPISVPYTPLSIQADFSGNAYVLDNLNKVHKYTPSKDTYLESVFDVLTTNNDTLRGISLNYKYEDVYYLGEACIYVNADKNLDVKNLTGIRADNVKEKDVLKDASFVTLSESAKLFKVTLNDYVEQDGIKYFKELTPISNPNVSKIYIVIADVDDTYYLVSYSSKLVALVRKTSVSSFTNVESDATIITKDKYSEYLIADNELNYTPYFITNDVDIYAKPIVDNNYKFDNKLTKGSTVYAVKEIVFNNKTMTLISSEKDGAPIGYVVSGYLTKNLLSNNDTFIESQSTIGTNADKKMRTIFMFLIISFTLSVSLILIEKKLLFNDKK